MIIWGSFLINNLRYLQNSSTICALRSFIFHTFSLPLSFSYALQSACTTGEGGVDVDINIGDKATKAFHSALVAWIAHTFIPFRYLLLDRHFCHVLSGVAWLIIVFNPRSQISIVPTFRFSKICSYILKIKSVLSLLNAIALLTHCCRVTHICINKVTVIGYDNGLSPGRHQAIIWTIAGILLIGP